MTLAATNLPQSFKEESTAPLHSFSIAGSRFAVDAKGIKSAPILLEQDLTHASLDESLQIIDSYRQPVPFKKASGTATETHANVAISPDKSFQFKYNPNVSVSGHPDYPNQTLAISKDLLNFVGNKAFAKQDIEAELKHAQMVYADGFRTNFFRAPLLIPQGAELILAGS